MLVFRDSSSNSALRTALDKVNESIGAVYSSEDYAKWDSLSSDPSADLEQAGRALLKSGLLYRGELHRKQVELLGQQFEHSVTYHGNCTEKNCVAFALDFTPDNRALKAMVKVSLCLDRLIAERHLMRAPAFEDGSKIIALYRNELEWTHAGIVLRNDRIVSKWGEKPIYEHARFEVPKSYGDELHLYRVAGSGAFFLDLIGEFSEHCG